MADSASTSEVAAHAPPPARAPYEVRDLMVLGAAAGIATVIALAAQFAGVPRLQPLVGLIVILSVAYAFSSNRRAIDRRTVAWGLVLQVVFALLVLKTAAGQRLFQTLSSGINRLLDFSFIGSSFVFGPLGSKEVWPRIMTNVLGEEGARWGFIFAFQGTADDHLYRGALRHPLLLRHHAGHRPHLRGGDAAIHESVGGRVTQRRRQYFHGAD